MATVFDRVRQWYRGELDPAEWRSGYELGKSIGVETGHADGYAAGYSDAERDYKAELDKAKKQAHDESWSCGTAEIERDATRLELENVKQELAAANRHAQDLEARLENEQSRTRESEDARSNAGTFGGGSLCPVVPAMTNDRLERIYAETMKIACELGVAMSPVPNDHAKRQIAQMLAVIEAVKNVDDVDPVDSGPAS